MGFINYFFKNKSLAIAIAFSLLFSAWLMFHTFSYENGHMVVASKVFSDFQSHIPLIRSFSLGDNFPPEYPLFSGIGIRYHFLFYLLVGFLEKWGMRIDFALNLPSIIGLAGLLVSIYLLTIKIARSKLAAWLAMVMALFSPAFSWLYFIKDHGLTGNFFSQLAGAKTFSSFGPYDGRLVSAFWNVNIFSNQRHLAFALALVFVAVWAVYYSKKMLPFVAAIAIFAILSWLHKAALLVLFVTLGCLFLAAQAPRKRIFYALLLGGLASLPGLIFLNGGASAIGLKLGYLYESVSASGILVGHPVYAWLFYWILNLGILPAAAFFGWFVAGKLGNDSRLKTSSIAGKFLSNERVWGIAGVATFAVANLFIFTPDLATNHKLVNFSIIIWDIYAAILLAYLYREKLYGKALALVLLLLLCLGGIFDLFPVINDSKVLLADVRADPAASWVVYNTKGSDRFFNTTYQTAPVTTAGRRIYFGWDYFPWSIGYDVGTRKQEVVAIGEGKLAKTEACKFFSDNRLNYIISTKNSDELLSENDLNRSYFEDNFKRVDIPQSNFIFYDIQKSCAP